MKKLILFLVLLCTSVHAASITVPKFTLEFDIKKGYDVSAEVELACRYERLIFGDSAEFETFYQAPKKLKVKVKSSQGLSHIELSNDSQLYFEYDNFFKLGKECRASFKVFFVSQNYALGHSIKPQKAVTFTLWEGFYDYEEGDQFYDVEKMRKYLHNTTYTFKEKVLSDRMHIYILQDGREANTNPWVETAIFNPATGKPYPPKK